MSNSNIAYSKDIIKQVSENMDMDYKTVKNVFDSIFSYANHLMKEEETTTIYLSQLGYVYAYRGILRYKGKFAEKRIEKYGEDPSSRKSINKIKFLDKELEKVKGFSKHKTIPVLRSKKLTKNMSFEELENFQNNEAENKKHRKSIY